MTPSAVGTLAKTPLAHALVYLRNKRLSGRFELRAAGAGRAAAIAFYRGRIASVVMTPPHAYFGSVAYELGLIDSATLDASLLELALQEGPRLRHGELLVAAGALSEEQRDDVLVEQVCRKVHHLFTLPDDTVYAFHEARPGLDEPPLLVDPIAPAWRGLRDYPPAQSVEDVLVRVGGSPLQLVNEDAVDRAGLAPDEAALARRLGARPMSIHELRIASRLPAGDVDLLVYLLVIAKCAEPISGVRATPSIGAMPAAQYPGGSGSLPRVQNAASSYPPPAARPTMRPVYGPSELGIDGIRARARDIVSEDYFEVLGVERTATAEAIRAAYFRLAKLWHPERLPPELHAAHADVALVFAQLGRAQQTLCDPDGRKRYVEGRTFDLKKRSREEQIWDIEDALTQRDFAAAESLSRKLAEADPNDADALALLAWSAARGGEVPEDQIKISLIALDRAVNADRTSERALFYRGCLAKKLGKAETAYRDFARIVHLNPKNVEAMREVRLYEMRARRGSG